MMNYSHISHFGLGVSTLLASLILVLSTVLGTSCTKRGINGDLDGMWQVMEVIGPDGDQQELPRRLYYSFQLHVCQLSDHKGVLDKALANLTFDGENISLDFAHVNDMKDPKELELYGIYANPVIFKVLKLDKESLVMQSGQSTVSLRKF